MKINDIFYGVQRNSSILTPPYVIAEAGVNHEGDMGIARRLIDEAAEAGANAIKFQTYKAGMLLTISGGVLMGLSAVLTSGALLIIGSIISFVGNLIVWDSDKYFSLKHTSIFGKKTDNSLTLTVCDCKPVLEKIVNVNDESEIQLYKNCKKLMRKYRVNRPDGLKKWNDDAEKEGCLK